MDFGERKVCLAVKILSLAVPRSEYHSALVFRTGAVHDRATAVSDLLADFECNARESAAGVSVIGSSREEIREAIEQLTGDCDSVVLGLGEFIAPEVATELHKIRGVLAEPTDQQLCRASVGISDAFAGVAATGSICVAMGPPLVAAASLLMPLHIVVLSANRIVARPRDLFEADFSNGEGLRRNLVFITGPSATADMGPLVRGVHGPQRLQILVTK